MTRLKKMNLAHSLFEHYVSMVTHQAAPYGNYSDIDYMADEYFNYSYQTIMSLDDSYMTKDGFDPKNGKVEAQIFMRRREGCLVAGIDPALFLIVNCIPKEDLHLVEIGAVEDGTWVNYGGDPMEVEPVLVIRAPYRLIARLETSILGIIARCSRIATHVLEALEAANGSPVLFFPQRFDLPFTQELDGWAYHMAVEYYNEKYGKKLPQIVSTRASAALWPDIAIVQGSTPHALFAVFGKDEVEAMIQMAKALHPVFKRIFLADFNNDIAISTIKVATAYWMNYVKAYAAHDKKGMERWRLWGIRMDTSAALTDASMSRKGLEHKGVNIPLVRTIREMIDYELPQILLNAYPVTADNLGLTETLDESQQRQIEAGIREEARNWCKGMSITVTGGFHPEKRGGQLGGLRAPVTAYGVGSGLLKNEGDLDFTMDLVRMWNSRHSEWRNVAKVGRAPGENDNLQVVEATDYIYIAPY